MKMEVLSIPQTTGTVPVDKFMRYDRLNKQH
jgi:hypothetical protein